MMYQIFQDPQNNLILMIDPQPTAPDGPMFIYDGGDTALLFRDFGSNIRLNNLSVETRPILRAAKNIHVVEMQGKEVLRDYMAPVRIVRNVRSLMM